MKTERADYRVKTKDGVSLRVRAVTPGSAGGAVIVLVHGLVAPLVPTYDLPINGPGTTFMDELASRGFRVKREA